MFSFKEFEEVYNISRNQVAEIANKQLHKENFAPCLDELRGLSSNNQVSPALFDKKKTFLQNTEQFAFSRNKETLDNFEVIHNSREHMERVCEQLTSLSESLLQKKHSAQMVNLDFELEKDRFTLVPEISKRLESLGISDETVAMFVAKVKDSLSDLRFKPDMLKESIENFKPYIENLHENCIGNGYMYTGTLKAHSSFVLAVEKFSDHLADGSSLDALIRCSHECEFLTSGILHTSIAATLGYALYATVSGLLYQPGAGTAFLKAVRVNLAVPKVKNDGSCFANLSGTNPQFTKIKHHAIIPAKIKEFIPNFCRNYVKVHFPILEKSLPLKAVEFFAQFITGPYKS